MPIDEFTKESAKKQLDAFCDYRVPLEAREQVNLTYSFWHDSIILYEVRNVPFPSYDNPSTVHMKIARMDFNEETKGWTLWAYDKNEKPLPYLELERDVSLEMVIEEIDNDPTCIFWG